MGGKLQGPAPAACCAPLAQKLEPVMLAPGPADWHTARATPSPVASSCRPATQTQPCSLPQPPPAMGALNPAATPAPAPAAIKEVRCRCLLRRLDANPFANDLPMSTLGPSGPSEAPALQSGWAGRGWGGVRNGRPAGRGLGRQGSRLRAAYVQGSGGRTCTPASMCIPQQLHRLSPAHTGLLSQHSSNLLTAA